MSAMVLFALSSCGDAIEVGGQIDESGYEAVNGNAISMSDNGSASTTPTVEFYGGDQKQSAAVNVTLQKIAAQDISGKVAFDPDYLKIYNAKNGTDYKLLSGAALAADGAFTIAAGKREVSVGVTFTLDAAAPAGTTWALPLSVGADSHIVYLVRDNRALATADKGVLAKGMVMFDGGTNPLNTLAWELENGKLLFDMAVLFSSNINWDAVNGRPMLTHNTEIRWAFDNRDKVLVPLQKRGVKIILSILGNHDQTGVASLSEMGAREFAAEVARFVYANDLDGVFLDDEYSKTPDVSNPYLAAQGSFAAARLFHELKKAMPDKLNLSYDYSSTRIPSMSSAYQSVEGDVGKYVDIAVSDYPTAPAYPIGSLTASGCTYIAMDVAANRGANLNGKTAGEMIDRGYGWYMVFALSPNNFATSYNRIAPGVPTLYGSKLRMPSVQYKKMDLKPYSYPEK